MFVTLASDAQSVKSLKLNIYQSYQHVGHRPGEVDPRSIKAGDRIKLVAKLHAPLERYGS